MSNSMAKVNLEDYLGSFSWDKRIVLLISKEENIHLIVKADDFFKRNSCENKARNLKYIRIVGNDITKYISQMKRYVEENSKAKKSYFTGLDGLQIMKARLAFLDSTLQFTN